MTEDSTPPYIWVSAAGATIISAPDSHDGTPLIRYVHGAIADEMLAELKDIAEMAALGTNAIIELDRADDWPDGWSGEKDIRIVRARAVIAKAEGSDING